MKQSNLRLSLTAITLGLALSAQAEVLKDPQWQAWLDAGKTQELERAAQARLSAQPEDAQAAVALGLAALEDGEPKRLEAALKPLQACVERQPTLATCHYALGSVYGVQAMTGGMMKAMGLAGRIKESLSRAVELDPMLYEARQSLVQVYLLLPGMAGGSVSKAKELAAAADKRQPEHAKALRAMIALQDKQWMEAERELQSAKPGDDKSLQADLRGSWSQLATQLLVDKQTAKAKAIFEQLQREHPTQAIGPYGLGRVFTEMGQPDEAVRQFERSAGLAGADKLPVDHRLGIALLNKGEKPQAKAALERFVSNKKANPRNLEDAKKRLAELS